jgi:hypothetical protein
MKRVVVLFAISFLTGCAGLPPSIIGNPNLVSADDIREIRTLVAQRKDIHGSVDYITVIAADRLFIQTGQPAAEWTGNTFLVQKRNGHWKIIDRSIQEVGKIVVTS